VINYPTGYRMREVVTHRNSDEYNSRLAVNLKLCPFLFASRSNVGLEEHKPVLKIVSQWIA